MKKNWKYIAFVGLLAAIIVCNCYMLRLSDSREDELDYRVTSLIHRLCTHVKTDAVGTDLRNGELTNDLTGCGSAADMYKDRFDAYYYLRFCNEDLSEEELDRIANDKAYYDNFVQALQKQYKDEFEMPFGGAVPDVTISAMRLRRADMTTPVDFSTPMKAKDVVIRVKVEYRGMTCNPEK